MRTAWSWFEVLRCDLEKLVGYLFLPLIYPDHFFLLTSLILRKRQLVRELTHLTHHRSWFIHRGIGTLIDVGSYIGSFAFAVKIMQPDVRVYAFEPLEEKYRAAFA